MRSIENARVGDDVSQYWFWAVHQWQGESARIVAASGDMVTIEFSVRSGPAPSMPTFFKWREVQARCDIRERYEGAMRRIELNDE